MDWLQIGATLGVSTLFLIAIGIFIDRRVWPLIEKRLERSDAERQIERTERQAERERIEAERRAERERFLDAFNQLAEGQRAQTRAIDNLANQIKVETQRSRTRRE